MCLDDPTDHGLKSDGTVEWIEDYFPEDISQVLRDCEGNEDENESEIHEEDDFSEMSDEENVEDL